MALPHENIVADPFPSGHGDMGVSMMITAMRWAVTYATSDKPVMTQSQVSVINAGINSRWRRSQNINQEIPAQAHCRPVERVVVTSLGTSYVFHETECN